LGACPIRTSPHACDASAVLQTMKHWQASHWLRVENFPLGLVACSHSRHRSSRTRRSGSGARSASNPAICAAHRARPAAPLMIC